MAKNEPKNERSNIILIITDDLGYSDAGFNGSKDIVALNLDQLAQKGMISSSGYVAHPFCGPGRAGLITGYPHTTGSQLNLPSNSEVHVGKGMPLAETFMSKMLQNVGYFTAAFGKAHPGIATIG